MWTSVLQVTPPSVERWNPMSSPDVTKCVYVKYRTPLVESATTHSLSIRLLRRLRSLATCGVSHVNTPPGNVARTTATPPLLGPFWVRLENQNSPVFSLTATDGSLIQSLIVPPSGGRPTSCQVAPPSVV